jgi:hypothetical protein
MIYGDALYVYVQILYETCFYALAVTNMVMVRNFDVTSDRFNTVGMDQWILYLFTSFSPQRAVEVSEGE